MGIGLSGGLSQQNQLAIFWHPEANMHIDFTKGLVFHDSQVKKSYDFLLNPAGHSSLGYNVLATPEPSLQFQTTDWLSEVEGTLIFHLKSNLTTTQRRILAFTSSGRGVTTDGPTHVNVNFDAGNAAFANSSLLRFDDPDGVKFILSWDQYGWSLVLGDSELVSHSGLADHFDNIFLGERENGGNHFGGLLKSIISIPRRLSDNEARCAVNPDHDTTTTADLVADSSLGVRQGNRYPDLNSIETSGRLIDNIHIGLQSDSSFSEDWLNASSVAGATLKKVGSGADPIVYGRKLQTTWTLASGQSNTYEASVNMSDWFEAGVAQYCTAFESTGLSSILSLTDAPLTRQSSIADVEANPGSCFVEYSITGTGTVYIHPSDSGDPNSNGYAYSYTDGNRKVLVDFLNVTGPMIIDNIPTDDGLIVEEGGVCEDIEIQHCQTHAMFLRPNSVARNITAKNTIDVGQQVSPFVANSSTDGGTFVFDGCRVIQDSTFERLLCGAFFSHKVPGLGEYTKGTVTNSSVEHAGSPGGCVDFSHSLEVEVCKNTFENCNRVVKVSDTNQLANITENFAHGSNQAGQNIQRFVWTGNVTNPTVNIRGNAVYHYGNSGGLIYITHPGTYNIEFNTFAGDRASGDPLAIRIQNPEARVIIRHNVFFGQRWNIFVDGDFKNNVVFENNVLFDYTSGYSYDGDTHMTLSEFELALGIQNSTNIQIDPLFSNTPSSWSGLGDAGATEPEVANRSAGAEHYTPQ